MKNRIIKSRIIKIEDFSDKRFKPSIKTKWHFIKLFEAIYKDFSENIDIKSLEWRWKEFFITLLDKESWEFLDLILKDNFWIKKCKGILCTNNLCVWIHSEISNDSFLKFFVYFIVKWDSFTLNTFLQVLTTDFKAKKEYYKIFWKQNRPPFSIIQDWWHPLQKYRFIVHEWVTRNMDQSIELDIPEASIHHSERECKWISPNNKNTWFHFFNFPLEFYNHNFDKHYYLTEDEKKTYIYWKHLWNWINIFTDLNENDIVMWKWTDKLSNALDYVVENIEKKNIKMLSFNCCCVPRIVWDDVYSTLKRVKEKINVPFVYQGQLEKTPYEQRVILLEEYISKLDIQNIKKIKNSISLFWFHENIFQAHLWSILLENWIKINTSLIPTIDIRLLELMYKSELFVFSPNWLHKEVFEYPFKDIWTKFISPKYPYWLIKTDSWLKEISWNFNIDMKISNDILNIKSEFSKNKDSIISKWYKVWIIFLWLPEIKKFFSIDYMNNIEVISFLEEMWFKFEFFIFDNFKWFIYNKTNDFKLSDWNHEKIEEVIFNGIKDKSIVNINYFSYEDDLNNIIKSKKLNLIYSDLYFDNRIVDMWINQFSLKNFYVWYLGALKTIKELINLCELNFYKKYSKYFSN